MWTSMLSWTDAFHRMNQDPYPTLALDKMAWSQGLVCYIKSDQHRQMLNCVTWAQCSINNEYFWIRHILLYQNLALMQTKTKTQIKIFVDTNLFQNLIIGKKQHCSITFPILATLKKFRWYKFVGLRSTFIGWTLSLIPLTPWRRLAIFTSTVNLLLRMNWFERYQSLTSYTKH